MGLAGVEQDADAVVAEAGEPERDPLDRLIRLLAASVGPLRHVGSMPGGDLVLPADERAAERADLERAGLVLEIVAEPVDELDGEVGVGVVVDRADDFLGVPRHAHLAVRVAGVEQAEQLGAAVVVEPFVGLGQQPAAR